MEDTLVLVHVLFRHGDRTPEKDAIYPKDPHKNNNFYPIGYGQLTNKGKQRSFKLGQHLRKNYDKLLGDVFAPEVIEAFTSDYDRTKATLQLVLAALFPPKKEQVWDETLTWQPIPYKYFSLKEDRLFVAVWRNPKAIEVYRQHMKGAVKVTLDNNSSVLQYIEEHSGMNINDTRQILRLACTLQCEADLGLKLPEWTKTIFPHPVEELATCEYDSLAGHPKLKSFTSGGLLEKILNDSRSKLEGKSACKMHLYSGHEINVAVLLRCFGFYFKHVPPYCSSVRLELHRINGVYGFKVFYHDHLDGEPQLLVLPKCVNSFCPIDEFEELIADVIKRD